MTRFLVRLFLVLIILGLCYLGYWKWQQDQPDYYWNRAKAEQAEGNYDEAKIHLANLLQKTPENSAAHKLLSELALQIAKKNGQPDTLETNAEALRELSLAATMEPEDLELQKQLVSLYLNMRRADRAALFAPNVLAKEPTNEDALFAESFNLIQKKDYGKAEENLNKLMKQDVKNRRMFQTYAMLMQVAQATSKAEQMQETFNTMLDRAMALTPEQLTALTNDEYLALMHPQQGLMLWSVNSTTDAAVAERRVASGLAVLENVAKMKSADGKLIHLNDAADYSIGLLTTLGTRHPLKVGADSNNRNLLAARAEQLWLAAISAGVATPRVYGQAADASLKRNDDTRGLELIEQGIAAAEKLTGERKNEALDLQLTAARRLIAAKKYKEAEKYIAPLLANEKSAGWGNLLAGGVASAEGRHDKALGHYLDAERVLGGNLLVRIGLASSYLSMQRWREALPQLSALHVGYDNLDAEQKAWAEAHVISLNTVHFNELRAYLNLNEWNKAQPHLDALKGTELEPRAWLLAATYLFTHKQPQQASALLADVRRRFPNDLSLVNLQVAMLETAGRSEEAGKLLERTVEADPENIAAQIALIRWRVGHKKYDEALAQFAALENKYDDKPEHRTAMAALKAQTLIAKGDTQQALSVVEALKEDPKTKDLAGVIEVLAAMKVNDLEGVDKALGPLVEANPRSGSLALMQAEVLAKKGDLSAAIDSLSGALDVTAIRDRAQASMLNVVQLYAAQKSPAEAIAKVDELMAKYPNDVSLVVLKADLEFKLNHFENGMAALSRLEQIQPNNATAAYLKAAVWVRANKMDRALPELERALKLEPKNTAALVLAAQVNLALQRNTIALDHARAALKADPRLWSVYMIQADALNRLARKDEAILVLDALVRSQPKFAGAYLALAAVYSQTEQNDKALKVYQAGRKEIPDDINIPAAEVTLLAKLNRIEDAEKLANATLGEKPEFMRVLAFATAFQTADKFDQAHAWGEKALGLAPEDKQAAPQHFLGNLTLTQGQKNKDKALLSEARDYYQAIVAKNPRDFIAGNNLAWLLATEFDQPEEAVKVVEAARDGAQLEILPLNFVDTLAVVYRKANRGADALKLLEPAVALRGDDPNLQYHLGMVLSAQKRPVEARQALQTAIRLGGLSEEKLDEAKRELALLKPADGA